MKASEIKNLTIEELVGRISEEKAKLEQLKFNHAVSPLDNPMSIKATRKEIARLMTELTSKQKNSEAAAI